MIKIILIASAILGGASAATAQTISSRIDGKYNDSGVALLCETKDAVIAGYARLMKDRKESAACTRIPNGSVVQVYCKGWNRVFARASYKGRSGIVSAELLDKSTCH